MPYKKRRTPAQIRATKKLVAMNKKRSRGNPRKRKNSAGPKKTFRRLLKSARQLTRGHKATAKWVRSGMPAQRNKAQKRRNPSFEVTYKKKGGDTGRPYRAYYDTVTAPSAAAARKVVNERTGGLPGLKLKQVTKNPAPHPPKGWVKARYVRVVTKGGTQLLEVKR